MQKKYSRLLLVVLFSSLLILMIPTSGRSLAPAALNRPFDPVVIPGAQLPALQDAPVAEIFVYAFTGAVPAQIPAQIDERNADGMFVITGDGAFDPAEELIFMAADAGDWIDDPSLQVGEQQIEPIYTLELTDPLTNDQAWAYIYSSPLISQTFTADYIAYLPGTDTISSTTYTTGFESVHGLRDTWTLGASADLLDREKIRIEGYILIPSISFSVNEDAATLDAVHAVDGPVRVTRVATTTVELAGETSTGWGATFFYPALISQPSSLTTPDAPVNITAFRASTDLSANAMGGLYSDANNTDIPVDGVPDAVVTTPATDWFSVSFAEGMFTYAAALPANLPNQSTYYKDDSSPDPDDTGDQLSYADAGLAVTNPPAGQSYSWLVHIYMHAGSGGDPGIHYQYYQNPIALDIALYIPPGSEQSLFLPLVLR